MDDELKVVLLGFVKNTEATLKTLAADMQELKSDVQELKSETREVKVEQKRLADGMEMLAIEQARLRDDIGHVGRRITRVEQASADQWAVIDRLRPQH